MTFHFVFRAQESTCNLLQRDMVVGATDGQPSLTFLDHLLTKTTGANTTTGKLASRLNVQRQQNRICTDDQLIELYQRYLHLLPVDQRGPHCYVFHQPKKNSYHGFYFLFCEFYFANFLFVGSWADEPVWFKDSKCGKNEFGSYLKRMCGEAQIQGHYTNQGIRRSAISMMTSAGLFMIMFTYFLSYFLSLSFIVSVFRCQ